MITQSYKIDMTPGAVPLRVKVSQYDVGIRQLVFQLYNGATACTSNSFDLSAQIVGTKQDQKGFAYEASVDTSALGIWVTVDITEQMTACAGDVVCEIRMYNNSSRISTANFILDVEPAALGADTDISETEIPAIIDAAREYAEDAEDAAERAEAAAAGMSAGAAIGNSTSVTSGVVDTNIDLGKTPSDGDRILMYVETEIESPVSLKTYNDGVAITTSFGSSGPETLAGLCLLEYTEDTTDYWALLWTDEGGGGGIGDAYAGLGIGKMVSFTNDVVNTDIDLHRAPIEGDRILFYHSSALANPGSLTVYNNGTAVTAGIFDFSATHPAGLTLMKYGALGWQTVQDIADGGYTAGTGISISGTTISNSAPQNGDNVAYAAVSSVTSGDLGYFNGKADYFMIDFRTDAEPYNGKYTLKLSLGATIKHAVLKDRDGNLYADDFMSGNLVQCVKTSSGSGTEQDPVIVTVLAVENNDAAYVTATGNPITLTDAVAGNAIEVSAEILASQDLHGYDKPWAGGAGFNKLDGTAMEKGGINEDGTERADTSGNYWRSDYIPLATNTYYIKLPDGFTPQTGNANYYYYDSSKAFISKGPNKASIPTAAPATCAYIRVTFYLTVAQTTFPEHACLNISDSAKNGTWEPYENICPISGLSTVTITDVDSESHTATVTVALGSTVYGGTLNLTTGELTITHANIASYNGETIGEPWISSMDEYTEGGTPTTGAQVVYTLATPTTTTLTAAQLALVKGYNQLSCNSGDMEITYKASGLDALKERVDELEDAVADLETDMASKAENSVVGTVESGTTASQPYAVGEHFIRNDKFCTAIASIASGATLTQGTNYVEGTIAEALNGLSGGLSINTYTVTVAPSDYAGMGSAQFQFAYKIITVSNMSNKKIFVTAMGQTETNVVTGYSMVDNTHIRITFVRGSVPETSITYNVNVLMI